MKKTLIIASIVFAVGSTAAIVAQLTGLISFDVFSLPVLLGGMIDAGLVALAFSDYAQRPRFRVRRDRAKIAAAAPARPAVHDPITMWTYTTRSA